MRRIVIVLIGICIAVGLGFYLVRCATKRNAITHYPIEDGRFGDCIMSYYRTKWLAWKYGLKFFYQPFIYSNELTISTTEPWVADHKHEYPNVVRVYNERTAGLRKGDGCTLYMTTYWTTYEDWLPWNQGFYPISVDPAFIEDLRKTVKPRNTIPKLPIPPGALSIAVHVRKGGGFDKPLLTEEKKTVANPTQHTHVDVGYPEKFPPDEFYIEQIAYLANLFPTQPIYAYIFTDDKNPQRLVDKYKQALNNPRITFDYRKKGSAHNANVVEDFFLMQQCDCLIRADSALSKAAQILAHYKVVISVKNAFWKDGKLIVDQIAIITSPEQITRETYQTIR